MERKLGKIEEEAEIALKLNRQRSQKYRNERKRKLDALDEEARKKVTGKGTSEPGHPQIYDNAELIEAVC